MGNAACHQILRRPRNLCLLTLAAALSSCLATEAIAASGHGNVRKYSDAQFGPPDTTLPQTPVEYHINPLDKLSITVLQLPDLPKDQAVDVQGNIIMPLIGTVHVQGLTTTEIEHLLETKFGERYLQAPEVQVSVTDAVGNRVTVDGAVKKPGVYPLSGSSTLLSSIALADGLADKAVPSRIAVFRTVDGKRMVAGFDLKKIRKGEQPDPPIYGNDVVVVDGSNIRDTYRTLLSAIPILAVFGAI